MGYRQRTEGDEWLAADFFDLEQGVACFEDAVEGSRTGPFYIDHHVGFDDHDIADLVLIALGVETFGDV